jgi:transcriptional regulator with XRE-family HTH domain
MIDGTERSANRVDKHVGNRVRRARLDRDMSQETLAGLLGVTFQQVQKYEKGANRVAASRLFDIANALGMPIPYFFERLLAAAPQEDDALALEDSMATPEAHDLQMAFAKIDTPKVRRSVVNLVRAIADEETEKATSPMTEPEMAATL